MPEVFQAGFGSRTADQARTLRALVRLAADVPVTATLRNTSDPMDVRLGAERWIIFADGYARPGTWKEGH